MREHANNYNDILYFVIKKSSLILSPPRRYDLEKNSFKRELKENIWEGENFKSLN